MHKVKVEITKVAIRLRSKLLTSNIVCFVMLWFVSGKPLKESQAKTCRKAPPDIWDVWLFFLSFLSRFPFLSILSCLCFLSFFSFSLVSFFLSLSADGWPCDPCRRRESMLVQTLLPRHAKHQPPLEWKRHQCCDYFDIDTTSVCWGFLYISVWVGSFNPSLTVTWFSASLGFMVLATGYINAEMSTYDADAAKQHEIAGDIFSAYGIQDVPNITSDKSEWWHLASSTSFGSRWFHRAHAFHLVYVWESSEALVDRLLFRNPALAASWARTRPTMGNLVAGTHGFLGVKRTT